MDSRPPPRDCVMPKGTTQPRLAFHFGATQVVKDQTEKAIARGDLLALLACGQSAPQHRNESICAPSGDRQPFVKFFHGKSVWDLAPCGRQSKSIGAAASV